MFTIYLAMLIFEGGVCHATVTCPSNSTQCEFKAKAPCAMTLSQCLEGSVFIPAPNAKDIGEGHWLPILGCSNKPAPKSGDVEVK